MDARKTVKSYIFSPNIVLTVILLIPPLTLFGLILLLCGVLPTRSKANKSLAKLESKGLLESAAAEMASADAKRMIKNRAIFTEHFVFCKGTGFAFTYDEIVWVYKQRFTRRFFFIPVQVTESLYLATKTGKPQAVASMGKDKTGEIKNAILEIYKHNNQCLIGYTSENAAKYKALSR